MPKFYDLEEKTKESLKGRNQITGIWKKIKPNDISEKLIKIKKGLKVIEVKIKANSFSLKEKTSFSRLVVDEHLSELQKIYTSQIDKKNTWSLPLYTISNSESAPDCLKFKALVARYVSFIKEAAGLLKRIERNPILEAYQQYESSQECNLEDELNRQIDEFWELDLESEEYENWKEKLSKEVSKIFELIKEKGIQIKEEQNLNPLAKVRQVDQSISLNQKTSNSRVDISSQLDKSQLKSSEMLKKLKEKKRSQGIVNAIKNPIETLHRLMENTLRKVRKKRKGKYEYKANYSNKTQ